MKSIAIITGAGSGIGKSTAHHFSQLGWECWLLGREKVKLERTASSLSGAFKIFAGDLASEDLIETFSETLTQLAVESVQHMALVNNAAQYATTDFVNFDKNHWEVIFWKNLQLSLEMTSRFLQVARKRREGCIVNVTSTLGLRPVEHTSAYSAYKAALHSLTETLALENARYGIRVNSVAPGIVDTPIHSFHDDTQDVQGLRQSLAELHPLPRLGQPMDVARAIYFLCDPKNSWVTGESIKVDGGIHLTSK